MNRVTPLMGASGRGFIDVVRLLLDRGAHVDANDTSGETALMGACYWGHADVAKLLLDKGSDVNARSVDGTLKGHAEVVRLLLGKGANVHAKAADGYTPLGRARENKNVAVVRLLEEAGARQ